ncbi:MAG: hypothetical protein RLZ25_1455 [Pseudomonadota bacterium]
MPRLSVQAMTLTNAFGTGVASTLAGLKAGSSALTPGNFPGLEFETWIGRIDGIDGHRLPPRLSDFEARNHRIIDLALDQDGFRFKVSTLIQRFGAHRIGLILGTSTSGILETEKAYRHRDPLDGNLPDDFRYRERQNTSAPAAFVKALLGVSGPAWVLSTACSSSSKVFASAARLLQANWCDAVIVGGSDSLCLTTLYGFKALDLVAKNPSRPMDQAREGISIGEGAGFMILTRDPDPAEGVSLIGYGESSDAYHMSSPHPEGIGASRAIENGLQRASLTAEQIDFTLLHGTGTRANDLSEDRAITRSLGAHTPCASIKGAIGHTLGAAGIMNAVTACLSLREGFLPGTAHLVTQDPEIHSTVLKRPLFKSGRHILTNAFGFGGSNAVLLFGRSTK